MVLHFNAFDDGIAFKFACFSTVAKKDGQPKLPLGVSVQINKAEDCSKLSKDDSSGNSDLSG